MSTKTKTTDEEAILAAIGRGEGIPSGWAVDFSKEPPVFRVKPEPAEVEEPDGAAQD